MRVPGIPGIPELAWEAKYALDRNWSPDGAPMPAWQSDEERFWRKAEDFGNAGAQTLLAARMMKPKAPKAPSAPGMYTPNRALPNTKYGDPIPDVDVPHTQLGRNASGEPAARPWDIGDNGNLQPKTRIDFTDHGYPDTHPNPHQHPLVPNNPKLAPKGGYKPGPAEPLR